MAEQHRWAVGAVLFNALVWGLSWWPFKNLQALGLHPLWATALVYLLSFAALLLYWPGAWRTVLRTPALWALALASAMTNVGFNWAVALGDVVRVVLLFYLMPAWAVLLGWWLLDERPRTSALARLALAFAGVLLVLKTPQSPWPLPQSALDGLALAGGLSFALTNVLLRKNRHAPSSARAIAMFGGSALVGGTLALLGTLSGGLPAPPALELPLLVWLLGLALAILVSNLALQYGAARLPAHSTAVLMLSEVVFAAVSAVALGAATLEPRTLAGGAMVMVSALWAARGEPTQ